jgi:hypothetical protein
VADVPCSSAPNARWNVGVLVQRTTRADSLVFLSAQQLELFRVGSPCVLGVHLNAHGRGMPVIDHSLRLRCCSGFRHASRPHVPQRCKELVFVLSVNTHQLEMGEIAPLPERRFESPRTLPLVRWRELEESPDAMS